jgi:hypothetical protein
MTAARGQYGAGGGCGSHLTQSSESRPVLSSLAMPRRRLLLSRASCPRPRCSCRYRCCRRRCRCRAPFVTPQRQHAPSHPRTLRNAIMLPSVRRSYARPVVSCFKASSWCSQRHCSRSLPGAGVLIGWYIYSDSVPSARCSASTSPSTSNTSSFVSCQCARGRTVSPIAYWPA